MAVAVHPPTNILKETTFRVALAERAPLVPLEHVKAHLTVIGAFARLLQDIDGSFQGANQTHALCSFLSKSLYRLELWVTKVLGPLSIRDTIQSNELPPLDVALVLHAYMLSPHHYLEDCMRCYPQLLGAGPFPLVAMVYL